MTLFWKNYSSTIILLACLLAGGVCGACCPVVAHFVKPFGDVFFNLLFVMVVPLIFFSVSTAFRRMHSGGNIGRVLVRISLSFITLWLICGLSGYLSTLVIDPLGDFTGYQASNVRSGGRPWGDALVSALSVSDFNFLFSKNSLLPLILFSAIIGAGVSVCGDNGKAFGNFLESGNAVITRATNIVMKLAPIGLGCYFAGTLADTGNGLLEGYLRVFLIYWALTVIIVVFVFPAIIWLTRGKGSVKGWWRAILPPSLTAVATQSSSIVIPGNIKAAVQMDMDSSVAETTIPLGTNLLKAGSTMCSVLKFFFLVSLCNIPATGIGLAVSAIGVAILSSIVIGAVAGGGVTGDLLVCSLLGVPPEMVGIIMIIGTIVDMPATLVNSQSTVVAASIVDRTLKKRYDTST